MTHKAVIAVILLVQVLCAFFFVSEILASVLGIPYQPLDWAYVELIEIGAAVGLILGVILGALALRESFRRTRRAEEGLRRASTAFMEVLEERFADWGLTPAERDVALFAIKGMSTQEIATLRSTSEGTVKAQTNAIYRKAGVSGRPQLLSLFIEDLMEQDAPKPEARLSA
jgi:DNA-binding CsgD family transcriptional regulator